MDTMTEVQKIANAKDTLKRVQTCEDVANLFICAVIKVIKRFEEVRVIFEDYYDISEKQRKYNRYKQ